MKPVARWILVAWMSGGLHLPETRGVEAVQADALVDPLKTARDYDSGGETKTPSEPARPVALPAITFPFQNPALPVESRVDDLIGRLDLAEKISLMGSVPIVSIPRLNLDFGRLHSECLHGVSQLTATCFPNPMNIACSWDEALARAIGDATSTELRVFARRNWAGLLVLSPTVNMPHDPRWGRIDENWGEDPLLASRLVVQWAKGMHGDDPRYLKSSTMAKHFAGNSVDLNRERFDSVISERNLREYYLPPFQALIQQAGTPSVMAAYNKLNGIPCPANKWLLTDLLRDEWGFKGFVADDVWAIAHMYYTSHYVNTMEEAAVLALRAGVDYNLGYPAYQRTLEFSVKGRKITTGEIDRALRRYLTVLIRLGMMDPPSLVPYNAIPDSKLDCQEHRALALRAARQSLVMLKNEKRFLPLAAGKLKSIAVVGSFGNRLSIGQTPYSPLAPLAVTPLQGLLARLGMPQGMPGVVIEATRASRTSGLGLFPTGDGSQYLGGLRDGSWVRFDQVDFTGQHRLELALSNGTGDRAGNAVEVRLDRVDGPVVATLTTATTMTREDWHYWGPTGDGSRAFEYVQADIRGRPITGKHDVYLTFTKKERDCLDGLRWLKLIGPEPFASSQVKVEFAAGSNARGHGDPAMLAAAVEVAAKADVVLAFIGSDRTIANEGDDRPGIELPECQRELLRQVLAANPRTVVVLTSVPSFVDVESFGKAPAILWAGYAGQAQGTAIAEVLFGDINPSGKTAYTWYTSTADLPPINDFDVTHGRTYLYLEKAALFPFGHGLSYTTFEYGKLKLSGNQLASGQALTVELDVKNTGARAGDEVVQLYVKEEHPTVARPLRELRDFVRVSLQPGETRKVRLVLPYKALAFFDEAGKQWRVNAGRFRVMVGASSADIRQEATAMAAAGKP